MLSGSDELCYESKCGEREREREKFFPVDSFSKGEARNVWCGGGIQLNVSKEEMVVVWKVMWSS